MLLEVAGLGQRFGEREAVVFPSGPVRFAELAERVRARMRDLAARGMTRGERVAVVCGRDADSVVSILASFELGCALLPLGADAPAPARERLVAAFRASWVVEAGKPARVAAGSAPAGSAVLALASSGSTGVPKLALVSAAQLRARIDLQVRMHGVAGGERSLAVFPLHHAGGLHLLAASVSQGACLVFASSAHPRTVVRACAEHGITLLPGPATLFDLLTRQHADDWPALDGLRYARSTAANLPLETHRAFTERFHIPLWQSYGSSETGGVCSNETGAAHEGRLALGVPHSGVDLSVCDTQGVALPDGEVGELVVRSPAVALGYEGGSEGGSHLRNGRFFSGDLGVKVDGLFYFRGRSKLLINVGGYKVDPAEVEEALRRHPAVADAVVVAHAAQGRDVVKAIVVACAPVEVEALTDHCTRELAPQQIPRQVEFRAEIPRNAAGKIERERL